MFDETEKYKHQGHFFFKKGNNLAVQSKDVPDLAGVYYILRLAKGKVDLVYIGRSGTMQQNGSMKVQSLRSRLNNKQDGSKRQVFFDQKMDAETIDGLDIYWFVTMDSDHQDLPAYVEGLLMQRFFEVFGRLPLWNKDF